MSSLLRVWNLTIATKSGESAWSLKPLLTRKLLLASINNSYAFVLRADALTFRVEMESTLIKLTSILALVSA
jgi:hypothetical protein